MFKQMTQKNTRKLLSIISIATASLALTNVANATIVEFQTSQGNFKVNLFDQTTPETVTNFLNYVNSGYYTDTIVHRVVSDFVVQAGGYKFEGDWPLTRLNANSAVINEPVYSNVTGTIAMAKLGSDVNSATDQWFFNLSDNSGNLDSQNGGFTAFGQVIGDGMTVVNKIANLTICSDIPLVIDEGQVCNDIVVPGVENFVVIEQIVIVDSSEVTDSDLKPQLTTNQPASEDSGGSISWFTFGMLTLLAIRKRFTKLFTK